MIEAILILSVVVIILGFVCFFSIKNGIEKNKEIKDLNLELDSLMDVMAKATEVENKKTEIRNKTNEKETAIINGTDTDNDVMPVNAKTNNSTFSRTGGKNSTL
jgi:hypothetical protein